MHMHMHMLVIRSYCHDSDRDISSFLHHITSHHITPYHVKCLNGHGHGQTSFRTFDIDIDDVIYIHVFSFFSSFYLAFSLILTLFL